MIWSADKNGEAPSEPPLSTPRKEIPLDTPTLQNLLREKLGLRVGPHTAAYIAKRLTPKKPQSISVIAADARTGRPIAAALDPSLLAPSAQPTLFK